MEIKKSMAVLTAVALLFLVGCAGQSITAADVTQAAAASAATTTAVAEATDSAASSDATETTEDTGLQLTLEELAQYDGKNGNPAYVAVDGVIYDVSASAKWKDGEHNGYSAGQDLTEIIKSKSPHGLSVLSRMPVVGTLIDG